MTDGMNLRTFPMPGEQPESAPTAPPAPPPATVTVPASRPVVAQYEALGQVVEIAGSGNAPDELRRFEHGLLDLRLRHQLYAEYPRGVEISEGVLYRARIPIPARVPIGTYTAETFLIRDGRVIAGAAREIEIDKFGFERFVADAAERWSFAYGISAVALSLLLGWGASAMFQRRYG